MTPAEYKLHAGRLKLAWKARKPYAFCFFRKGKDGKPILVIDRREEDGRVSYRKWKALAVKKEGYEGTVGKDQDGNLVFKGESTLSATVIRRAFVEGLLVEPEFAAVSALVRGATFLVDADEQAPPPQLARQVTPEPPEPDEDPLEALRRAGREALAAAPILNHTAWAEAIERAIADKDKLVVRSAVEKTKRAVRLVTFLAEAVNTLNQALEDKVREYNAKVETSWRVPLTSLRLLDLETARLIFEEVFEAPSSPPFPVRFHRGDVGKALKESLDDANQDYLAPMDARAKQQRVSDKDCEALLKTTCGSEWTAVKARLLDAEGTKDSALMWQMVLFRKRVVDAELLKQKELIDGHLVVKSVGSQNLTSDYDLTLSTNDGSGREIAAIRQFNAAIKARFGKQPGVVFDTNLYAKDFLRVDDNVFGDETDGAGVDEVEMALLADRSDQDVAALTKMRQYMSPEEWLDYLDALCEDGSLSERKRKEIEVQLEETDALFLMKNREIWDQLVATYEAEWRAGTRTQSPSIEKLRDSIRLLASRADSGDAEALATLQETLVEAIETIGHSHDDLMLEVRNDIYLARMQQVRELQARQHQMEQDLANTEFSWDPETEPTPEEQIDAVKEKVRKLIGEANFFAAEAYLSEGPLAHVVLGNQSGRPDILEKLRPEHFLESINEQTGDFLKDVQHYRHDDGLAFYQTSKYLSRMLDGIVKLAGRDGFTDLEEDLPTVRSWGGAAHAKDLVDTLLLPIRGAKGEWSTRTSEEKAAQGVVRATRIFGLGGDATIAALKRQVLQLSLELNRAVRTQMSLRPGPKQAAKVMSVDPTL